MCKATSRAAASARTRSTAPRSAIARDPPMPRVRHARTAKRRVWLRRPPRGQSREQLRRSILVGKPFGPDFSSDCTTTSRRSSRRPLPSFLLGPRLKATTPRGTCSMTKERRHERIPGRTRNRNFYGGRTASGVQLEILSGETSKRG